MASTLKHKSCRKL